MRENLVGNIDPSNGMPCKRALRRSFRHSARRRVALQRDFIGQFPVAGPDIAGSGDGAVLDGERVDRDAEPIRRQPKKDLPNLGADVPDGASRLLHGKTARRHALIGTGSR
jgi:hypothetical protein